MSAFWSGWVVVMTLGTVIGCLWLLQANSKRRVSGAEEDTTGHVWDKDLKGVQQPAAQMVAVAVLDYRRVLFHLPRHLPGARQFFRRFRLEPGQAV